MAYTLTWENCGILLTSYGHVSAPTLVRAQAELYGDPRFESARYAIFDLCAAIGFRELAVEIEEFVASTFGAYLTNATLRVAVVTADAHMQMVLDKMASDSAYPMRLFATVDEARRWAAAE